MWSLRHPGNQAFGFGFIALSSTMIIQDTKKDHIAFNYYPAKWRGILPDILSRRGRKPSWLKNQAIFRKIEQDNSFIIQHMDDKAQFSTFIGKKKPEKYHFSPRHTKLRISQVSVEYARQILSAL